MDSAKLYPQYVAAMIVCLGAYTYGNALAWTSNITDDLKDGALNELKMDYNELSSTASLFSLGAMFSCSSIGFLADAKGRKFACLITVIPLTVGWLSILAAENIYMVYIGRFLTGLGGGGFYVVGPLYITEIAQIHIRGSLSTLIQSFTFLGVLHSNVLGWALPLLFFNMVCIFLPLLFGTLFWFQPETPLYYLKKGRTEDAEKSFRRLRGQNYDYSVELKYFNLELEQIESIKQSTNFFKVLKTKPQIKATFICCMLMFFQQFSGIYPIIFYTKDIFINSKSHIPPYFSVIVAGSVGFLGAVFTFWLIDRLGRTLLLKISASLSAVAAFLLGLFFTIKTKLDEEDTRKVAYFLPMLALLLFLFSYHMGLGPIPWLTCSELLTVLIRARLSSIIGAFHWLLAFLVTKFYLPVSNKIGIDSTCYIFMSMSLLCVYFVNTFVPETKNRTYIQVLTELETFF